MDPTPKERIAAFQLAIETLPSETEWSGALASRSDGCSPHGVFDVIDRLKMQYQASIGNLADGEVADGQSDAVRAASATAKDSVIAYQIVSDALPRAAEWEGALSARTDGTRPAGILQALDEIRMDLHIRIGDLMDAVIQGDHDG